MEWGDFLNSTAQEVIGNKVAKMATSKPPVATNMATGKSYNEGQPVRSSPVAGVPPVFFYAGGAVALLLVGLLVMRKIK